METSVPYATLWQRYTAFQARGLQLDLSMADEMEYYNGLVFTPATSRASRARCSRAGGMTT